MAIVRMFFVPMMLTIAGHSVLAEDTKINGLSWVEQKCVLYQNAWDWAYDTIGPDGISEQFVAQNAGFVEGGCIEKINVCPESEEELEMANMLTLMTMSEGMASTFVPFNCASEKE